MNYRILWSIWAGLILTFRVGVGVYAQTLQLATKPLSVTSTCPGSILTIPFSITGSYTSNTVFTIQMSDGGEYKDVSVGIQYGYQGTYDRAINITIPADLSANTAYSIRIKATNPDVIGSPSQNKLFLKGVESRPPLPLVDSLTVDCMSTNQSSMAGLYSDLSFRLVPGATPRLYYTKQRDDYQEYAEFPYQTQLPTGEYVRDKQHGYFQLTKTGATSTTYVYPVSERTYYISQLIDGCESELAPSKLRIIWKAGGGPGVINPMPYMSYGQYGQIAYCQGDQAYPLNVNGHRPPPENYQVRYWLGDPTYQPIPTATFIPPIPDTSRPGYSVYTMNLYPIDYTKGCANDNLLTYTHVKVTVNPTPTKPIIATTVVSYYQGQVAMPLSATTTDSTASLVWYGTDATGGVGTSVAPKPLTNQVGPATYYVAQKIGSCESERVPVSVLINPLLGIEDATLAEIVEVFPNPTVSSLTIRIRGLTSQQAARLELVDLAGQCLYRKETQQEMAVLPMTDYPTGSYLLLINIGNRKTARRIMKL
ncbi:T9SS type A sorting domain-containing protein [Spirosoma aerolatum]|uniref:T9SS type A sorting domain-containing protein n=1 Tax=Spirosoma aerolatum TaxID=1211326 RepID=UPI001475C1AD|nr:T9SS type A sorting domain-containing protein [Spirosoma aerolatum]